MAWFRWHEGSATDPKFHLVARKSGQPLAFVVAVWALLLERASAASERGNIAGFDCESMDAVLGMPDGATCAIIEAMQAKGLIDEERVCKWAERQPKREDDSRDRVREYRERERSKKLAKSGQGNEPAVSVTHGNACNESVTHGNSRVDKIRREEIRKEENTPPPVDNFNYLNTRARVDTQEGGVGETVNDSPGIEFVELRDFWNANVKPEGPMAGFQEYKQLKSARDNTGRPVFPGNGPISSDVLERIESGLMKSGAYGPKLANYLREQTWLAPKNTLPPPRASPVTEKSNANDWEAVMQKNAETFRRVAERHAKAGEVGTA